MGALRDWLRRLGIERREARAWALYDWANSVVYTTIVGALFPAYFVARVAAELGKEEATRRFSWATTIAIGVVALSAPLLGTLADVRASKKRLLAAFAGLGVAGCLGLFLVDDGDVTLGLVLFGLINVGAAGSLVFYDALLPHVAAPGEIDRLSGTGFGLGYLGGGLLFLLHVLWVKFPESFGLPGGDSSLPYRLAFLSVGLWWAVFSLPLLRHVREPRLGTPRLTSGSDLGEALARLRGTLGELRRYRQAFLMLLAFLVYSDGIATVIRMAAVYSQLKGFAPTVALQTFLAVQFVGFPAAIAFGRLAERFGPKRMILTGLAVYVGVCFYALSMDTPRDFLVLGIVVGMVQGGCQALGRSLFARFVPRQSSGEFFSLLAVGEKFAGVAGPLVFALAVQFLPRAEHAILTLVPFFVLGAWILTRVDVEEGSRVAREAELAFAQRSGAPPPPSTSASASDGDEGGSGATT